MFAGGGAGGSFSDKIYIRGISSRHSEYISEQVEFVF